MPSGANYKGSTDRTTKKDQVNVSGYISINVKENGEHLFHVGVTHDAKKRKRVMSLISKAFTREEGFSIEVGVTSFKEISIREFNKLANE